MKSIMKNPIQEYVNKYGPLLYSTDHDKMRFMTYVGRFINQLYTEFCDDAALLEEGQTADELVEYYDKKCNDIIDRMTVLYGPCPIKKGAFKIFFDNHCLVNSKV